MMDETYEHYYNNYGLGRSLITGGSIYVYDSFVDFYNIHHVRHRDNGPATIYTNGSTEWLINGKRHRLDGPAVVWNEDEGPPVWWINGYNVDDEIRSWVNNVGIDLEDLSDNDKVLIKLVWGDYSG